MLLKRVTDLEPGMIAGTDLYDCAGNRILHSGGSIQKSHCEDLVQLGVEEIYVRGIDEEDAGDNIFSGGLYRDTHSVFTEISHSITSHACEESLDSSLEKIEKGVGKLVDFLKANDGIIISYLPFSPSREHLSYHCVNVCLYSLLAGVELGFEREKLLGMGVGALLHDIGLLLLERELHPREDEFSRRDILEHSWRGYELLKRHFRMRLESLYVILQHHERFDGSGYPQGLKGAEIPDVCRVVAIADCYDALTTNRIYRPRIMPSEAVQFIRNSAADGFDQVMAAALFRRLCLYPVGLHVALNNGKSGYVVAGKAGHPSRPVVRVQENGSTVDYDLSREYALFIERAEVGRE